MADAVQDVDELQRFAEAGQHWTVAAVGRGNVVHLLGHGDDHGNQLDTHHQALLEAEPAVASGALADIIRKGRKRLAVVP